MRPRGSNDFLVRYRPVIREPDGMANAIEQFPAGMPLAFGTAA
jgi:hypothetical protein